MQYEFVRRSLRILAAVAIAATLVSCGGGGGGATDTSTAPAPAPAPAPVPAPGPVIAAPAFPVPVPFPSGAAPTQPPGISLIAGNSGGAGRIDATGAAARFHEPRYVALDASGNVYVVEWKNQLLRRITPAGVVTTVAALHGDGSEGFTTIGAGGAVEVHGPSSGIGVDAAGRVYIVDDAPGGQCKGMVRRITPGDVAGQPRSDEVLVGCPGLPFWNVNSGFAVDAAGTMFSTGGNRVWKTSPDGQSMLVAGSATAASTDGTGSSAGFAGPGPLALAADGTLYLLEGAVGTLRRIAPDGVVSSVPTNPRVPGFPRVVATGPAGIVYVGSGCGVFALVGGTWSRVAGDANACGGADGPVAGASFSTIGGIAVDASGTLYVGDLDNNEIRKVTAAGEVSTLAGARLVQWYADGPGTAAQFRSPYDVATDGHGAIYVGDASHVIRKVDAAGVVTTLAGKDMVSGATDGVGSQALFQWPTRIAASPSGTVYTANDHGVRRITPDGVVKTFFYPRFPFPGFNRGFNCSGGAMVADAQDNVFVVCRSNAVSTYAILRMTPAGEFSSPWEPADLSTELNFHYLTTPPDWLALAPNGNIIAASRTGPLTLFLNNGRVFTSPGTDSTMFRRGVAVDADGSIYVAESTAPAPVSAPDGDANRGLPGFIRKVNLGSFTTTTVVGSDATRGTLLGPLPGSIDVTRGLCFIAPKTLAAATPGGIIRIVLP